MMERTRLRGGWLALGIGAVMALCMLGSCSQRDVVHLRVDAEPGTTLLMCINGHVAELEGLKGTFSDGDTVAYRVENQEVTIRGEIQSIVLPDPSLRDAGASVVSVDVRQSPGLERMVCGGHRLAEIDLTRNANLEVLILPNNVLTQVDVTHCPNLRMLDLEGNPLGGIDLSGNPLLEMLWVTRCSLRSLDVTQCPELKGLQCSQNRIAELDLHANRKLRGVVCAANLLTELPLPQLDSLTYLSCSLNQLKSLNASQCPALRELWCQGNQLDDASILALVESLPLVPDRSGRLVPVDSDEPTEGNVSSPATESLARVKGWEVFEVYDARAASHGHLPQ